MGDKDLATGRALRLIDDVWAELSKYIPANYTRLGLPRVSPAEAARKSALATGLLTRYEELDISLLPYEIEITVEVARSRIVTWMNESNWYWTAYVAGSFGFFSLFAATAYSGGFLLNECLTAIQGFEIEEDADCDRYLALVMDYARLVSELGARTRGQTERGILMPKPQAAEAAPLLELLKARSMEVLLVNRGRHATLEADVAARLREHVAPAFDVFLSLVGDDYVKSAPENCGMSQYPNGAEIYAALVKFNTTLNITPSEVHAIGLERMAQVRHAMAEVRALEQFTGDDQAYRAHLDLDARWHADDAAGVVSFFNRYIDAIQPRLGEYFNIEPKAAYGVRPLPQALEASMTFGYYSRPTPEQREGYFMFNTANLTKAGLYNLGALTYHELVPGHHFHISTQQENENLHPLRSNSFVNAYNEGWAEYAATLAGEMGLYTTPAERFGRLVMDAFLTSRLVVDTGLNAFGWSLEEARAYMRSNSFLPEAEICSESVRYSCDIPSQALAYKLGDTEITRMRSEMQAELGSRFDVRDFHDAVLGPGALPLSLLARHVLRETKRLKAGN
jgi:Uncharacterized protein conserved in bacteria